MQELSGKVVWVTGASSGIGAALVHELAAAGAKVILSARQEKELEKIRMAAGLGDDRSMICSFSLDDIASFGNHVSEVIAKFGRVDVLINNGGISQRSKAAETDPQVERQIMEVNYFGTVSLTRAVLPHMIQNKSGQIVVISSIAGKFGFFLRSSYSASKHALHGYFESLRLELKSRHIHVMLVCPGRIRTAISQHALTATGKSGNVMEEEHVKGMSAEACAHQIIRGIRCRRDEIFIGGSELRAVWIKRFFPALFQKLIFKQKPKGFDF
ncbi:MAG: SDR family oxidoreductase [Bacteroidia bacterium]|nr:SDR family oxidoreductase [Bacteroidia bacterium]